MGYSTKYNILMFHHIALFTHISTNNKIFSTQNDYNIELQFDDLETELVCLVELFYYDEGKISRTSYIDIYPGYNSAYCFLDIVGTTYEFIFYGKDMKNFIEKEFDIF